MNVRSWCFKRGEIRGSYNVWYTYTHRNFGLPDQTYSSVQARQICRYLRARFRFWGLT